MKHRKGFVLFMVVFFICVGALLFSETSSVAEDASKKPIKIGVLSPFSPPGDAAAGKRIRYGAELAVKFVNEEWGGVRGGRPIELAFEDDAGTPAEGVAGFRKLVEKEKVVAVTGQYHSSVCIALTGLSKDFGVPLFTVGASSPKITATMYPTIFSIMSSTPAGARFRLDWIKGMGWKRVAIIAEDTDYGTGYVDWLTKLGEPMGFEFKSIIYPRTTTDLTPTLLETKAWKPEVVINMGVGASAYLMVKQAYDVGLFPQVPMGAAYAWPLQPEAWEAMGEKGKGICYLSLYHPAMKMTYLGEWMVPKYKQLHNEDPTFYALNVFGQIIVISQALNMSNSDKPEDLVQALRKGIFVDWQGIIKFKEEEGYKWHQVNPAYTMLQSTEVNQPVAETNLIWPPELGGTGKILPVSK
jgi:branched-chain amino acid transport system substrate-binding protein